MLSWMSKKLEVRETRKYGKGIFALDDLKKDEIILVMGGYIFTIEDENNLNNFNEDKPIEISEDFSICPLDEETMELMPQHYINHNCEPNCGFKGQLFIVPMRDIKAGEEINYDYAMIIHSNPNSTEYFKMKCLCQTKDCRGIIDEDGWKIPKLQKKYDGYFQWYIQEKINKLK